MSETDIQHAAAVVDAGRPADALRLLGTHLAQNPDDASAIRVASVALRALGRGQEAVDAAVHAVRLEPESEASWRTLAFAQLEARDLPNAVQSAVHAMQLAREDWTVHANLSAIAGEQDPTGALTLQAAQEAVRLAPNESEAQQSLGVALLRHKQRNGAVEAFSTALRLDPQNELARHNLAVAMVRRNPARATVDLAALTAQSPNDPLAFGNFRIAIGNTLGQIHTAAFCGALLAFQMLRIINRSIPTDGPARLVLGGIALATLVAAALLIVRAGRTLGASLGPVFRFVVARDRLIAAWAVVDALGILPLVISPFLPRDVWTITYTIGWLFVVTGLIIRVVRARSIRRAWKKR